MWNIRLLFGRPWIRLFEQTALKNRQASSPTGPWHSVKYITRNVISEIGIPLKMFQILHRESKTPDAPTEIHIWTLWDGASRQSRHFFFITTVLLEELNYHWFISQNVFFSFFETGYLPTFLFEPERLHSMNSTQKQAVEFFVISAWQANLSEVWEDFHLTIGRQSGV